MSLNKNDRKDVEKHASSKGFKRNSDGSTMTDGKGHRLSFSKSGGSAFLDGNHYTDKKDAINSKKWP